MQTSLCALTTLLATTLAHLGIQAADWSCWRGPDGLGVSAERQLPTQWSADQNRRWKTILPGKGASSPIVVGDHVYFLNGQGNCTVTAAQPSFKVVAENHLNETTLSSPALAFGHVFLRTDAGLYCFGQPD